jgi:outer membrane protein
MRNITILLIFFSISIAKAQTPWTFDSCLNYGLEHNLELKQLQYQQKISSLNYTQSCFNLLPTAGTNANHKINNGRSINPENNEYVNYSYQNGNIGAYIDFNIFNGFADYYTISRSKFENNSAKSAIEIAKLELAFKTLDAYLNVLYFNDFEIMSANQLEVSKEQSQLTQNLYNLGKFSYTDVLEMQATESANNELAVNANNGKKQAILYLSQLINVPTTDSLTINPTAEWIPDSTLQLIPTDQLYSLAESHTAYVKNAEIQLHVSDKDVKLAYSKLFPTLTAGWYYGSGYSGLTINEAYINNRQLKNNLSNQIYFSINLPIFERFSRITSISKANMNKHIAENKLDIAKQQLYKQLQKLHTDLNNAWAHYKSRQQTMLSMNKLYQYSTDRFKIGLISTLEFKLSQSNCNKANTDFLQAKYELLLKQQILKLMIGS